jgi:hypothetical protein
VELVSLLDYGLATRTGTSTFFQRPSVWGTGLDVSADSGAARRGACSAIGLAETGELQSRCACVRGPKPHRAFSTCRRRRCALDDRPGRQRQASTVLYWGAAIETARAITLASHDDWRLPNQKEKLWTLFDDTIGGALIDQVTFPGPLQLWSALRRGSTSGADSYPCPCVGRRFPDREFEFPGCHWLHPPCTLTICCRRAVCAVSGNDSAILNARALTACVALLAVD